jgi:hypothetical protein
VRLRVLVLTVLGLTLWACSASQSVPPTTQNGLGVVTGLTGACQTHFPVRLAHPKMKVGLYLGPTFVSSETVRSGDTYRFSVAPGLYHVAMLLNGNAFSVGAGRRVTVAAGRKVTVDLVGCSRVHGILNVTPR